MEARRNTRDTLKLLLGRPSPRRNIRQVEKWNALLACDKLIVEYYMELEAYDVMQKWFIEHTEYDYLVIAPDDLQVLPRHIKQLQKDLEKKNYPILTGVCNVWESGPVEYNIAYKLEAENGKFKGFPWIVDDTLPEEEIFQVEFSGFPLMAIRRDIVEQIPFTTLGVFGGVQSVNGGSLDLIYCWKCKEAKIPIMVDKRLFMQHFRSSGTNMVGTNPRNVEFMKCQ